MSFCLYDDKCPVCGREIYESVICKHKEHITISITSSERPMTDKCLKCGEPLETTTPFIFLYCRKCNKYYIKRTIDGKLEEWMGTKYV
jgi:predicted RNA-binding Zn-ribbon protein involved in translation (DUF1610 family)